MVLTTRRFFDQTYDATTFTGANGPTILAKASACQIVGLIQQLGELSEFASDIYHALSRDTFQVARRIDNLTNQVTKLEANLTTIDGQLKQMPSSIFFDTTVDAIWRRTENMAHTFFSEDTRPLPLVRLVNETFAPPSIHLLNEFAGKDCTVLYSDPSFFFQQWALDQAKKLEQENEANRQRRRRNRRKRKVADPVEVQGIEVKVYDARGKEFSDGQQHLVTSTSQPRNVNLATSTSFHTTPSSPALEVQHSMDTSYHQPLVQTPSHSNHHVGGGDYDPPPPPQPAYPAASSDVPGLDLSKPEPAMALDDIFQQKMANPVVQPPPPAQPQPPPPSNDYAHIPPPTSPPPPSSPTPISSPPPPSMAGRLPPPPVAAISPTASNDSSSLSPPSMAGRLPPPPMAAIPPTVGDGSSSPHQPPPPAHSIHSPSSHDSSPPPPQRPGGHLPPPPMGNVLKPVDTSADSPPARPPNPMMAAGRGDLLSALRGGVGLRKVDEAEKASPAPAASGGGGGLLDAIRNRPMLRKASVLDTQAPAPQPRGPAQLSAVMELLERRKVIQESSDDDDYSDDDWD